jgi:hypothetical protein
MLVKYRMLRSADNRIYIYSSDSGTGVGDQQDRLTRIGNRDNR